MPPAALISVFFVFSVFSPSHASASAKLATGSLFSPRAPVRLTLFPNQCRLVKISLPSLEFTFAEIANLAATLRRGAASMEIAKDSFQAAFLAA
jgi:hypothetical protein